MKQRYLWLFGGLTALLIVAVTYRETPAQRMPFFGGQVGRFVVAHATDKQIVILDTTTGKLYKATEKDFAKFSDLPKQEPMDFPIPIFPGERDKGPAKDRPRERDKEKDKEKAPARDKEKDGRERDKDKEKEKEKDKLEKKDGGDEDVRRLRELEEKRRADEERKRREREKKDN